MTAIITKRTKRSTEEMISDAVDRQQSWLTNRREATRRFLRRFNVFNHTEETKPAKVKKQKKSESGSVLRDYWFPIMCAFIVIFIAVFVIIFKINTPVRVVVPSVPEPIIKPVENYKKAIVVDAQPSFDMVRIDKSGNLVIAGRGGSEHNISVLINGTVVATEHADKNGEFVYAPKDALRAGNYTISLIDTDRNEKAADSVFVYVPENYKNSMSLLMTSDGSKILQKPQSVDGDLVLSNIDYLDTGRIVVTGRAIPKLRVSLTLNDKYLGFARVSNYKNFGLGADVGQLKAGEKYTLKIRLHDAAGTTIKTVKYEFVMPESTGCEDTFYTVRRGDSLWVIARNFLRRGVLFSIIADCNDIENPNLIYPNTVLQIPVQ
jgi:nucleoid-associated protein YgaU